MTERRKEPISTSADWTYDLLEEYYDHIQRIAKEKFKLDTYPNQLEIISSEQMLEAYATHALPVYYDHWATGMRFIQEMEAYKHGKMGLAYEVVINSNPCISYLMEGNTLLMQILVIAHAAFGHNHFFKNNYMFRQWTDAEAILDYLVFAKRYIRECEELYGADEVEEVVDACHALQYYSIDKYKRPSEMTRVEQENARKEREKWERAQVNVLWSTIPKTKPTVVDYDPDTHLFPPEPQENLLYFIEKNAPNVETWKREIMRIVRKLGQYFYPQMSTQLMNEGFATFMHYHIITEMYNEGLIGDGYMLEFIESHTNVVSQLDYNHPYYSGLNVYALGFAMYQDIKRVSTNPTEEDRRWFRGKEWVGRGDWLETILWAAENFKDESFITEFLSPKIMRDFHLFLVVDDDRDTKLEIAAIHNDSGYRKIREALAKQYNVGSKLPEIQVAKGGVDVWGDRSLTLEHIQRDRRPLDEEKTLETLRHTALLWGYDTRLNSLDETGKIRASYDISKDGQTLLDIFIDQDS